MDSPNPSRKRGRGVVQRSNPEEQESSMKLVIIQPEDVSEHFVDSCETLIHDIDSSFSSTELDSEVDPWLVVASLPPRENIPLIPAAYLPDPEPKMRHRPTLVLDLDETLVHCSTEFLPRADFEFGVHFQDTDYNIYVKCRPHLNAFLKYASTYFEVVIFTASQKAYADRLLNILDPENNFIHHRLFRDACVYVAGNYLKDLSVLNRDLRRTVIVDNSPQAFGYHVENGIPILTWIDDENDCELVQLVLLLEVLRKEADHEDADVRSVVERRFRNTNRVAFYRAFLSSLEHS
jgi:CTD small phosphatase-like protein 2